MNRTSKRIICLSVQPWNNLGAGNARPSSSREFTGQPDDNHKERANQSEELPGASPEHACQRILLDSRSLCNLSIKRPLWPN
jgi:hypothetical protein